MRVRVKAYDYMLEYFVCIDEQGKEHRIDFRVARTESDNLPDTKHMVGAMLDIDRTIPFVEIAFGVKVVSLKE